MRKRAHKRAAMIGGLVTFVSTAPIVTTVAAPARADSVAPIVWCDDGYYIRTFSSGLTSTPHDFSESVTGVLADCSSPAATGDPTVNGIATIRSDGTGTGSCTNDGTMTENWQIEWANGRTTTIRVSTTVVVRGNRTSILSTGVDTAGEFQGAKSVVIPLATADDVACGTSQGMAAVVGRIATLALL